MTVAAFKLVVQEATNVQPTAQRLIWNGSLLVHDNNTLSQYGISGGHTIHMVAKKDANAPSTPTSSGTTNTGNLGGTGGEAGFNNSIPQSTPTGNVNPFEMLGVGGGDLNQLINMYVNNPQMKQQADAVFNNPQMLQQVVNSNPMLQQLVQNNPMMQSLMSNPEMLADIIENIDESGFDLFSAFGGETGNTQQQTDYSNMTSDNPYFGFQQPNAEENYSVQLQQLEMMGFTDKEVNANALVATFGNVEAAIDRILSGGM